MNPAINAKAIAGAICVLIVVLCRKYWPDVASDGAVQEAIRVILEVLISSFLVWITPNKPALPVQDAPIAATTTTTLYQDAVNDPKNYRS